MRPAWVCYCTVHAPDLVAGGFRAGAWQCECAIVIAEREFFLQLYHADPAAELSAGPESTLAASVCFTLQFS